MDTAAAQRREALGEHDVPESVALVRRVHRDDVDLPETVRVKLVHLRPTRCRDLTFYIEDQESRRIEPRLVDASLQVVEQPRSLFGVVGEGGIVLRQPRNLVDTRSEGSHRGTFGNGNLGYGKVDGQ